MKTLTILLAAAALATALSTTARADQASAVSTHAVRIADLDTSTAAGAATLYRRMNAAAGAVCGQRETIGSPFASAVWKDCVKNAMRDGLAQLNRPAVTAYAAARGVYAGDRAFKVASAD